MLVKYEFLKILRKRSTLMVMAASLLITAFLFGLPILQFQIYVQGSPLKGTQGIRRQKEQMEAFSVTLTEEYLTGTVEEVHQLFEQPGQVGYDGQERFLIEDAYWNGVAPREGLLQMIAKNYAAPNESAGYDKLLDIDPAGGIGFYRARQEKIGQILSAPEREMTPAQQAYWQRQNDRVQTPFRYGYHEGWAVILSSFELLMFALLAVCIALAPVFSGEYQAGTDAVILCAKYGKTKLAWAKIAAALLFGLLAFTLHVAVAFGLPLAAFGADGWDLPLQIANTAIPYPFTFLQAALLSLGVVYLVLVAMIALTLFLSAHMKSPYLVLAVLVPVLFLPLFLAPHGTTGFYDLTLFLLPYRAVVPEFGKYISYQLGGLVLDAFSARAALYALLSAALLPFAKRGFQAHQVSS